MQFFHKVNISVFVGLLVATLAYSVDVYFVYV